MVEQNLDLQGSLLSTLRAFVASFLPPTYEPKSRNYIVLYIITMKINEGQKHSALYQIGRHKHNFCT